MSSADNKIIQFWAQFLPEIKKISNKFNKIKSLPSNGWLGATSKIIPNVGYWFNVAEGHAKIMLLIGTGTPDKEVNKQIFDELDKHRRKINACINQELNWRRMDTNGSSRISIEINYVDYSQEKDWPKINNFFLECMPKFITAFDQYLLTILI
ncbi:DUF4268 domain-containing protein [Haliscomenobacter sp.]|uniref:DUF4268 domain-containing protein n=1 Tax=Haliscomenobacter sp. TaxID=2717303 RepID=UPI0033651F99